MAKRLTPEQRVVREARRLLDHDHGSGFRCVHCAGFWQRLRDAVEATEAVNRGE